MIWSDKHDVPVKTALVLFTPGLAAAQIQLMSLLNVDIMMFKFSVLVQADIFSFSKVIRS